MFGFKHKLARAGALVGACAAVMAASGIGASSASAAPACPQNNTDILGNGASLQRVAQEIWTGREVPSNVFPATPFAVKSGTGYVEKCGNEANDPTVSYVSTGSGAGLVAFGFTPIGEGALNRNRHFISTDDAPNAAQIEEAEGASEVGAEGSEPVIIPVTQTAIAVVANLPEGCAINGGIRWKDLNRLFAGTIDQWSELETDNGNAACKNAEGGAPDPIERVVREDSSGTTFQFKNYLSVLQNQEGGVAPGCGFESWAELMPIGAGGEPNILWPCEAGEEGRTVVVDESGNRKVAEYVGGNENTIGYAALPEAQQFTVEAGDGILVPQQNGQPITGPTYDSPLTGSNDARCGKASYNVPADARRAGGDGIAVDWSEVFGAKPRIGKGTYPICTLTYSAAWVNYADAGYASAANVADVVEDYIEGYVLDEGQEALTGKFHAPLPPGSGTEADDVADAAAYAAEQIE